MHICTKPMLANAIDLVCRGAATQLLVPVIPSPDENDEICASFFVAVVLHDAAVINVVRLVVSVDGRGHFNTVYNDATAVVPESVKNAHRDKTFVCIPLTDTKFKSIVWDVLDLHAKNALSEEEQDRPVTGMRYEICNRRINDVRPVDNERIEKIIRKICAENSPVFSSSLIPFYGFGNSDYQYASFTRAGTKVYPTILKLNFERDVDYYELIITQKPIIRVPTHFSRRVSQGFTDFQFLIRKPSSPEMLKILIQPVAMHYSKIIDEHTRLTAMAMALHHRLGDLAAISCLGSDQIELIARSSFFKTPQQRLCTKKQENGQNNGWQSDHHARSGGTGRISP